MNVQEAFKEFELKPDASDEEIKKQYKTLSKKYHPDRNKDSSAEDKFKKINAAHEVLKNRNNVQQNNFQEIVLEHIQTSTNISFVESVLGCKKDISYSRIGKCSHCQGQGQKLENNGCKDCNGTGMKTVYQQRSIFRSTCDKCHGRQKTSICAPCNGQGSAHTNVNITVSIPGGVVDKSILRLQGMGNYFQHFIMEHHTDVHLTVHVKKHEDLYIEENNVCFKLPISLKEAVSGITKKVPSIDGDKDIVIPKLSKNKDEIIIKNLGVSRKGNQKIILDVSYPENIEELIKE